MTINAHRRKFGNIRCFEIIFSRNNIFSVAYFFQLLASANESSAQWTKDISCTVSRLDFEFFKFRKEIFKILKISTFFSLYVCVFAHTIGISNYKQSKQLSVNNVYVRAHRKVAEWPRGVHINGPKLLLNRKQQ